MQYSHAPESNSMYFEENVEMTFVTEETIQEYKNDDAVII